MGKPYDKYYLKKNPATNDILVEDDKPILGECAKRDCRLEPRHVKILNRGWINSGVYYVEVVQEVVESPKDDARELLENEANDLGISFRANISDEKLQERVNETKLNK